MSDDESLIPSRGEAQSPAMRELFVKAQRVASTDLAILVTGEPGVGKGWLARWLHAHSRRSWRRFVPVNCGAIPDTLLDMQLFGHSRDGYTDTRHESIGMFEAASGGTLFLDDIGEASPAMQAKLLPVVEAQQVPRVGEWQLRPFDVRIVAATSRNLQDEVARGQFRKGLLYRLRVVELRVPPLRERPGDLRVLARDLLEEAATRYQRPITRYAPPAMACLFGYDWPGNVRELKNAIDEACQVATGSEIQIEDLPDTVRPAAASPSLPIADPSRDRRRLPDVEQMYIDAALERHLGNRRRAAEDLGISLSSLYAKLSQRRRSRRTVDPAV